MKNKIKYTVPIACILIGCFFAVYSILHYDLYHPTKGPMAGFMPLAIGLLLILLINLLAVRKKKQLSQREAQTNRHL